MLTGTRAFSGDDATDTIVAVVSKEPDWNALPAMVPAGVRRLLRRSLEKEPKRRLDSAAAARLEIDDALTGEAEPTAVVPAGRHQRYEHIAWGAALLLAVIGTALAMRAFHGPTVETATTRFSLSPPDGMAFASSGMGRAGWGSPLSISPDGSRIVLVTSGADGTPRLWLRPLDTTTPQLLDGTDGASSPFWSPDGRWIAFFAGGKLKRVAATGRDVQVLCDSGTGGGGTWNRDDTILFAPAAAGESGLARVAGWRRHSDASDRAECGSR